MSEVGVAVVMKLLTEARGDDAGRAAAAGD
jgi:hypothetical protein